MSDPKHVSDLMAHRLAGSVYDQVIELSVIKILEDLALFTLLLHIVTEVRIVTSQGKDAAPANQTGYTKNKGPTFARIEVLVHQTYQTVSIIWEEILLDQV